MRVLVLLAVFFLTSVADADQWLYTFEGELPDGASSHSQIADGESFVAQFGVDSTAEDQTSSDGIGSYAASCLARLSFQEVTQLESMSIQPC